MEADANNMPNYKIFWVDDCQKKHVVKKFTALDDDEAHAKLDEYAIEHVGHEYYYGRVHYIKLVGKPGNIVTVDADERMLVFNEKRGLFTSLLSSIGDFFCYWLWQKPIDWWYCLKDAVYLLKHGERRSNQWNLDMHLVDSIELNLPSLIENSHSMMFLDDAIVELHGNDPGFDLKKYHEEHYAGYADDVQEIAMDIQRREYSSLLQSVKLYKYYLNCGIVDVTNPDEVKFDKEFRKTLPVKPGTYDEFKYDELKKLVDQKWNDIWDWIKKHGHTLYD